MKRKSCAQKKIGKVMKEFKNRSLKRRDGVVVRNRKESIAIALSQARRYCGKKSSIPEPPKRRSMKIKNLKNERKIGSRSSRSQSKKH